MKSKKISGGAVVGCVFISILLTIVLFSVTNTLVTNRVFTGEYISQTISNLFKAEMKIELDGKEYDSISDGFYGVLEESINEIAGEDGEISEVAKKEVEDFMEETGFEDFISDKLGAGMEAILAGEDVAILTEEDIVDFVDDNEKVIEETFDVEIDKEMLEALEEELKESDIEENLSNEQRNQIERRKENLISTIEQAKEKLNQSIDEIALNSRNRLEQLKTQRRAK